MTPAPLIVRVGRALYGDRWQSELARALDVAGRTVRRWAAGEYEVPAGVWGEILALVRSQRRALGDVERLIAQQVAERAAA